MARRDAGEIPLLDCESVVLITVMCFVLLIHTDEEGEGWFDVAVECWT